MIAKQYITHRSYSSKVILLGEYGVIHGGEILAAPLTQHTARWSIDTSTSQHEFGLQMILDYLRTTDNKAIDISKFAESIQGGIYFESNIPSGYGLGSSGAITAGLYDLYAFEDKKKLDPILLQQDLIEIESCFHGVSSGIDPLVIYLDKGVHIDHKGIHIIDDCLDLSHYFLIDTGKARKTSPLVEQYLERAKNDIYLSEVQKYKSVVSDAIRSQLTSDHSSLAVNIAMISEWQYEHLDFAIMESFRDLWQSTLQMDDMSIKLCGAGGGGYLLGYAADVDRVVSDLNGYTVLKLGKEK